MSTSQREFTPSRENDLTAMLEMFGITTGSVEREGYSQSYAAQHHVAQARERDRDSRAQLILWGRGEPTSAFERYGRHFVRLLALDHLGAEIGAPRGSALTARPNEELRRKIALFKRVQAAREATFEFIGKGKYGGKDVPAA